MSRVKHNIKSVVVVNPIGGRLPAMIEVECQRLGWSQNELAKRAGLSSSTMSNLMTRGAMKADSLEKVLLALGKDWAWLDREKK